MDRNERSMTIENRHCGAILPSAMPAGSSPRYFTLGRLDRVARRLRPEGQVVQAVELVEEAHPGHGGVPRVHGVHLGQRAVALEKANHPSARHPCIRYERVLQRYSSRALTKQRNLIGKHVATTWFCQNPQEVVGRLALGSLSGYRVRWAAYPEGGGPAWRSPPSGATPALNEVKPT